MDITRVRQALRAGAVDPFVAAKYYKDSPDPPPTPDYAGMAATQGAANVQTAIVQSLLNRPNENTPYGSRTWTQTGTYTVPGAEGNAAVDLPMFQSQINLTPLGQQRLDQEQRINTQLGDIAEGGIGRVNQSLGQSFDMGAVPAHSITPDVAGREAVTAAILERQAPMFQRNRERTENDLLIRGHNAGGQAWEAAQDDLSRAENDARLAAIQAGGSEQSRLFGLESDARARAIQEQAYLRSLPLNEMNALRTGSQVTNPQFSPVASTGQIQSAPIMQAGMLGAQDANNRYNQQVASNNSTMNGIFGLAGAALPFFI